MGLLELTRPNPDTALRPWNNYVKAVDCARLSPPVSVVTQTLSAFASHWRGSPGDGYGRTDAANALIYGGTAYWHGYVLEPRYVEMDSGTFLPKIGVTHATA